MAQLAQFDPAAPIPFPLPPVFLPGTLQNDDLVRSTIEAAQAAERAVESIFNSKANDPPSPKEGISVDELLGCTSPGQATKRKAKQFERPDGISEAEDDFFSLNPTNVRPDPKAPGVTIGTLPDGRTANVRAKSTEGRPTLKIYDERNSYLAPLFGGTPMVNDLCR